MSLLISKDSIQILLVNIPTSLSINHISIFNRLDYSARKNGYPTTSYISSAISYQPDLDFELIVFRCQKSPTISCKNIFSPTISCKNIFRNVQKNQNQKRFRQEIILTAFTLSGRGNCTDNQLLGSILHRTPTIQAQKTPHVGIICYG